MKNTYIIRVNNAFVASVADWNDACIMYDKFQDIYQGCLVELVYINELSFESVEISGRG